MREAGGQIDTHMCVCVCLCMYVCMCSLFGLVCRKAG